MKSIGKWQVIGPLGSGGQSDVFRVRHPRRGALILAAEQMFVSELQGMREIFGSSHRPDQWLSAARSLLASAKPIFEPDRVGDVAAAKIFRFREAADPNKALARFQREVEVLERLKDEPGIVPLLDHDLGEVWMVTKYFAGGSLAEHLGRFKGNPAAALKALRPIVAAVAKIHEAGFVHRDIKPVNIFVDTDGSLVLGDFGIVFDRAADNTRVTSTDERVGTRDWMPTWAHTGHRVDKITPKFDLFTLGKVLWAMIADDWLPLWRYDKPSQDLAKRFPLVRGMEHINHIFSRILVEDEEECPLQSAGELLPLIDQAITLIDFRASRLAGGAPRRCRVCGFGVYLAALNEDVDRVLPIPAKKEVPAMPQTYVRAAFDTSVGLAITVRAYACNYCGHVEMFQYPDGGPPAAWQT